MILSVWYVYFDYKGSYLYAICGVLRSIWTNNPFALISISATDLLVSYYISFNKSENESIYLAVFWFLARVIYKWFFCSRHS